MKVKKRKRSMKAVLTYGTFNKRRKNRKERNKERKKKKETNGQGTYLHYLQSRNCLYYAYTFPNQIFVTNFCIFNFLFVVLK